MYQFFNKAFDVVMCFGPILAFAYQYYLIIKKDSIGSFSINLCAITIFSNIFRIGFYLFEEYSKALLLQSLLMILVQVLIISACVKIRNKELIQVQQKNHLSITSLINYKQFWKWRQFSYYIITIAVFHITILGLSYFLSKLQVLIAGVIIGYIGLMTQSILMIPQIVQNHKQKRVKGVSHLLICVSIIGDAIQMFYYIINDQPMQFIMSGIVQILMDILIVLQIIYFKLTGSPKQDDCPINKDEQLASQTKISQKTQSQIKINQISNRIVDSQITVQSQNKN